MKFAALAFAATAVLAAPGLQAHPENAEAASVCSAKPYKQWLPLSKLPAAESYCHKEFPLATPVCGTKTVTPKPVTHTTTELARTTVPSITRVTVTTEIVHTSELPKTITKPRSTKYATATAAPVYIDSCASNGTTSGNSTVAAAFAKFAFDAREAPKVAPAVASMSAQLRTLEGLGKKAQAKTICDCIQTNPACTYKTRTLEPSTHTSVKHDTTTIIKGHSTETVKIPMTKLTTATETITKPAVTTTVTSHIVTPTITTCSSN